MGACLLRQKSSNLAAEGLPATLIGAHRPDSAAAAMHGSAGSCQLPQDVVLLIFSHLEPAELVARAALVNKAWCEVATSSAAWDRRFLSSQQPLPPKVAHLLLRHCTAGHPWPLLWAQLRPSNLLQGLGSISSLSPMRNTGPSGWVVSQHGGNGWAREATPCGLPGLQPHQQPLPRYGQANPDPCVCLASSFYWCEVMQAVNLVEALKERGLSEQAACAYLDCSPVLHFKTWFGCRFDCRAVAEAHVILDAGLEVLPPYRSARRDWAWERPTHATWTSGRLHLQQNQWQAAECQLSGYAPGARRAFVVLRGKDDQFWQGHYGAKLAAPELNIGPI